MEANNLKPIIHVYSNENSVSTNLAQFVIGKANEAIKKRGLFTVGLSGGC